MLRLKRNSTMNDGPSLAEGQQQLSTTLSCLEQQSAYVTRV